jgi:predicted exporter
MQAAGATGAATATGQWRRAERPASRLQTLEKTLGGFHRMGVFSPIPHTKQMTIGSLETFTVLVFSALFIHPSIRGEGFN